MRMWLASRSREKRHVGGGLCGGWAQKKRDKEQRWLQTQRKSDMGKKVDYIYYDEQERDMCLIVQNVALIRNATIECKQLRDWR